MKKTIIAFICLIATTHQVALSQFTKDSAFLFLQNHILNNMENSWEEMEIFGCPTLLDAITAVITCTIHKRRCMAIFAREYSSFKLGRDGNLRNAKNHSYLT